MHKKFLRTTGLLGFKFKVFSCTKPSNGRVNEVRISGKATTITRGKNGPWWEGFLTPRGRQ